jgi:very-short-patch-repair endonuclease
MRLQPTASEAKLWEALRGGQLGVRSRRQVVLGPYIVDFFAPSVKLVVEVDGGIHRARRMEDARRDEALNRWGIRVLRIEAMMVERDLDEAILRIRSALAGNYRASRQASACRLR